MARQLAREQGITLLGSSEIVAQFFFVWHQQHFVSAWHISTGNLYSSAEIRTHLACNYRPPAHEYLNNRVVPQVPRSNTDSGEALEDGSLTLSVTKPQKMVFVEKSHTKPSEMKSVQ